jgi:hypothetical protein
MLKNNKIEYLLEDYAWIYHNPYGVQILMTDLDRYMPKTFIKQIAWFKPGTKMEHLHGDYFLIQNMKVWVDPKPECRDKIKEL